MRFIIKLLFFAALALQTPAIVCAQTSPEEQALQAMLTAAQAKLDINDVPGTVAIVVAHWEKGVDPVKEKSQTCQTLLLLALECNAQEKDADGKALAQSIKDKLNTIESLVAGQNEVLYWIYLTRASLSSNFFENSDEAQAYTATAKNYLYLSQGMTPES